LREFTPDLAKQLPKEMAIALKPVVKAARGYAPSESQTLSNWKPRAFNEGRFPTYNATLVKRGIGYKTSPSKVDRRGFRSLARLFNKSAAGAIYETAGRKTAGGNFSPRLGGQVTGNGQKMQGRAMFRAWAEDQGKTNAAVIKAIEESKVKFYKAVGYN
jgi:hypothetical protein